MASRVPSSTLRVCGASIFLALLVMTGGHEIKAPGWMPALAQEVLPTGDDSGHSFDLGVSGAALQVLPMTIERPVLERPNLIGLPLFECSSASFAWSQSLKGFVVMSNGDVWAFDRLGERWTPEIASAPARLSPDQEFMRGSRGYVFRGAGILDKYQFAQRIRRLGSTVVGRFNLLVPGAKRFPIVRTTMSFDGGSAGCEAYRWNGAGDRYERVELGGSGDLAVENFSWEARQLLAWLNEVVGWHIHVPIPPTNAPWSPPEESSMWGSSLQLWP